MKEFKVKTSPDFELVFKNYPISVRNKMQTLRELVIETAKEIEGVDVIEETLKWGEPSFLTKNGSTLRMDWKSKNPNQYAMYFKCTSQLVETFKSVYKDTFHFEGNRAIIFQLNDNSIPRNELKKCVKATLSYHKVKHLKDLGI
jgi:hypothetical protein